MCIFSEAQKNIGPVSRLRNLRAGIRSGIRPVVRSQYTSAYAVFRQIIEALEKASLLLDRDLCSGRIAALSSVCLVCMDEECATWSPWTETCESQAREIEPWFEHKAQRI
jgi:hypothetical protein